MLFCGVTGETTFFQTVRKFKCLDNETFWSVVCNMWNRQLYLHVLVYLRYVDVDEYRCSTLGVAHWGKVLKCALKSWSFRLSAGPKNARQWTRSVLSGTRHCRGFPLLPEDREELLAQAMEASARDDLFGMRPGVVPEAAPSESAVEHARAPEEDASLPEDVTVELLAMLEEHDIDDEEEMQVHHHQLRAKPFPQTRWQAQPRLCWRRPCGSHEQIRSLAFDLWQASAEGSWWLHCSYCFMLASVRPK